MMRKSAENVVNPSLRLSVAWTPFAKKLAAVLGTLEEDQFLVISVKRSNRFLQFAAQGTVGVRAETTSNSYLEKSEQLDMQQIAALRDAGWHGATGSPADSTPENDPDGSPNFFVDFPAPVPVNALADLAVRTLAEILRVPYPGFLEYEAFDADGKAITLPELGLKRVMRSQQPAQVAALPERLLATLKETTGIAELEFDEDGDIGIRYGTVAR